MNSDAGKKAQDSLQKKLKNGIKKLNKKKKISSRRRKKNIQQKKINFSRRIYKKK